jgi:hypothetical protein
MTRNTVDSPDLPPCARCGAGINDDEDALLVFSKADQQVAAEGRRRSLADLGELTEAYCEKCTNEIERGHARHERLLEKFRHELAGWGE